MSYLCTMYITSQYNTAHYEARVEALRMATQTPGGVEDRLKLAELYYDFLSKGIAYQPTYPNGSITYTTNTLPTTITNG